MRVMMAVAAMFAFLATAPAASADDLQGELVRLELERQEAYVAGDRAVLERHFAEEYVHTNLRGGHTDRAAELDFYTPGVFSLGAGRIENVVVHRYGDAATLLAIVIWEDAHYRPNPSADINLSGTYSVSRVYVWRDDRWQLALSHASQMPAA